MRKTLVLTTIAAVCIALVFVAHTIIVKRNSPVSVKWRFETSLYCYSVVADDMVYVAYEAFLGWENCLYAVDKDSGELEWEYCEDDAEYFSSPSVADGVVYTRRMGKYSDDRDYLYAVDAASGTLKWSVELGDVSGVICASPTVVEGIVYLKSTDTLLYAVDAQNGELLWQFETEEFILSSAPAAANGVVCITTDNYLYAIDAQSGELNWQYMMRCPWDLSPTVADDAVYMVTIEGRFNSIDKGRLYSIDIASGEKRWEYECETYGKLLEINAPPSVVDGMVFLGATHIDGDFGEYVHFGAIYAIDADSGELRWRYETGESIDFATTVVNGFIYVATHVADKPLFNLHAIDARTGAPKWKYTMEGFSLRSSAVTVVEDTIFFNMIIESNEGIQAYIYALEILE